MNDIRNKIDYAKQLSNQLNKYFISDKLKKPFIKFDIVIQPWKYSQNYYGKDHKVTVILFYVDQVNKKDYIPNVMSDYPSGQGEATSDGKYIVVYGDSKEMYYKDYFKDTFEHEVMHILDDLTQKQRDENYWGHPVDGFKDNNGIPYPGMYGNGDDNIFDEQYAEYFTCKAQRREYIHDLITTVNQYMNDTLSDKEEVIQDIIKALNNKSSFLKLVDDLKNYGVNYAPLALLYHLAFSKQKNGNKHTALQILQIVNDFL